MAPLAGLQIPERHGTDAYPNQALYGPAEERSHAADLPFAPLAQRYAEPGLSAPCAKDAHVRRRRPLAVHDHAAPPGLESLLSWLTLDQDVVFLGMLVARMRQAMGQLTVVREQDEPLAVHIQPANGEQVPGQADEVEHGAAPADPIPFVRDDAARLVQGHIDGGPGRRFLATERPAVHTDVIGFGVGLTAQGGHMAVH